MGDVRKSKKQSEKPDSAAPRRRASGAAQQTAHALQERVKELACLFTIANILQKPGASIEGLSSEIIDAIVAAYQYPEVTAARIFLGGKELSTPNFNITEWKQDSPIMASGKQIGAIEVYYLEDRSESDEGPFMKEERNLLNAIAYQLGIFVERIRMYEYQQRLSAIVDSSSDAIIGKTLDGIITSWNQGAELNYGYTAKEAIGQPIYILVPREYANEVKQFLKVIEGGGSVVNHETVRVTKYGRRITILLTISPIRDASGKIVGASTIAQNITKLKKAEEEIMLLSNAFRAALDPILVLDMEGKVRNVNEAARRLFETEELGVSAVDYAVPEDREKIISAMQGLIAGSGVNTAEFTIVTKNGRRVPIEATGSLMRDAEGKATGFVVVERDITARKQTEEALRQSENRYRLLAENATDVIYTLDMNQRVTYVSPSVSRLLGYSVEEAFTKTMEDILTPDSYCMQVEEMKKKLEIRNLSEPATLQLKAIHKDGSIRNVEVTASFILDKEGALLGILGICRDITARKRAEEALIEAHNAFQHQATHDSLTGVLNRRAILDILSRELARANRQHVGLAIGICDIDHFKKINDTYGHPVGDEVLCGLVRIMESNLRQYDTLGRFGGDEFLVITPGVKENDAIAVYQRLLSEVAAKSLATKSGNVSITVSIGVKVLTGEEHMEELLKAADDALYDAKNGGRNRVFFMHDKQV